MKKLTAFISVILSLIPIWQPLFIKTGLVLSSSTFILSLPEKVIAKSAYSYFTNGLDKVKKKDYYGAISDLNKAIKIDPNFAQAYHWRGLAKLRINDFSAALLDINKTLQFLPNDEFVWGSLGLVEMARGDMKSACFAWRKASALGYENATKWVNKSCIGK